MSHALNESSLASLGRLRVSDERLVVLIARGDARAFGEFYERHAAAAMRIAWRIVADERVAEDVCQDAFLGIWSGAATFAAERGSARTWALGVVRNRAIDTLRRRAVHTRHLATGEPTLETLAATTRTEDEALRHEGLGELEPTLGILPAGQRQAVALAFYVGLTHAEIAALLDVPVGTIKGRIRLGLRKMRPLLDPSAGVAAEGAHGGSPLAA